MRGCQKGMPHSQKGDGILTLLVVGQSQAAVVLVLVVVGQSWVLLLGVLLG